MGALREMQSEFAKHLGQLLVYAFESGFDITLGEAMVDVVQCPHCKKKVSKHCKGSFHHKRLAIDLNLFKHGVYLRDTEDHRPIGTYWEELSPMCTWGGNFPSPDGGHYSYGEE